MRYFRKFLCDVTENSFMQFLIAVIFIIPLIGIIGQYISSGFIFDNESVNLLYWPGCNYRLSVFLPVYISFGIMAVSYIYGIVYMCRKKNFLKVVLISFIFLFLNNLLGDIINFFIGIRDMQNINNIDFDGLVDKIIFASWYNPLWEEIFFTGIPLLLYTVLTKGKSSKVKSIGKLLYFICPSILCSIYHIPNHGPARIVDTFFTHILLEYIAFKFSFFANLVMHYIFDAMIVLSFYKYNNIPHSEIKWLVDNSSTLNTLMSILIIVFVLSVIFLAVKKVIKHMKDKTTLRSM